jgi:hypothetical protein
MLFGRGGLLRARLKGGLLPLKNQLPCSLDESIKELII